VITDKKNGVHGDLQGDEGKIRFRENYITYSGI
jgi:hypothetical protein